MAYARDFREFGRCMADDVHEILNGAKPSDIPIYLSTKYELVISGVAATRNLSLPGCPEVALKSRLM